jgi:branched-chain amino acid transport system substrate-binding protein
MVLYQIQDGQYKVVAPAEWASAKLIHPIPTWDERGS